ncbi:MAG: glycosyltransferase family 2 protein [Caldicoprobacterales bacterium]|jgi:glycosyltransferase involved in cell wall biosynthesis|nr:glycosyltransferase family 2 protein [Clostridiales bacterium]
MSSVVCSVVIPMYNEEEVIQETYRRLKTVMDQSGESYELLFVNDGSRDRSAQIISQLAKTDSNIRLIDFSRNFGHQIAVTAGMDYASGQAIVIIDADLQDPPEVILRMLEKWREGYEVVYGKRLKRHGETIFKKATAYLFYRILGALTNDKIPKDTGDFRLIDRKVCDAMKKLNEKNRFLRGMINWVGFRQVAVEYVRDERWAGETKYPLKKMLKFASDGIFSFTYKPLKLATYLGFLLSFSGFLYLLYVLYQKLFTDSTTAGWASLIAVNLVFNGIILLILGILGEYVGRIYEEVKGRPLYIVKEEIGFREDEEEN